MITPKELVGLLPPTFDPDYIDGAVVPYLLSEPVHRANGRRFP